MIQKSTCLLIFLVAISCCLDINLGYVGKKETQFISLSKLFDTIEIEDKFNISNPEDYQNLISLDEDTKIKNGNYKYLKLQTCALIDESMDLQEFVVDIEKISKDQKKVSQRISFTILNDLSSFIDISELKKQSLKVSKTFIQGSFSQFDLDHSLIYGNDVNLDKENSDSRLDYRLKDEFSLKLKGEPDMPKKERDPKRQYMWKLFHTENFLARFNTLYNIIWVYRCQKPDFRLKEKVCTFIKTEEVDTWGWPIFMIENQDYFIIVCKSFGKTIKFIKINSITGESERDDSVKIDSGNENMQFYRYGKGFFFTAETQLFDVKVTIFATETGEFKDFKKIGSISTPFSSKNGNIATNISHENQKTYMYVKFFSDFPFKLQFAKYDISDLKNIENIKPVLSSEILDVNEVKITRNAEICSMHNRTYFIEITNGFQVGSRGFKKTDRIIDYQLQDHGVSTAKKPLFLKCLPDLNKILLRAMLKEPSSTGSRYAWVILNGDSNAEASNWIHSISYKTVNKDVLKENFVITPTGLHSNTENQYFILSQNISGELWKTYYLRLNGPKIYLDLTKEDSANEIEKIKLRFSNTQQYQELAYNVRIIKKQFQTTAEPEISRLKVKSSLSKWINLENYIKFKGDVLNLNVVHRKNSIDNPIDNSKIEFQSRIQISDQFLATQKISKIERFVQIKDSTSNQNKRFLGIVRNEVHLFNLQKETNKLQLEKSFAGFDFREIQSLSASISSDDEIELVVSDYSGSYSDRIIYSQINIEQGNSKLKHIEQVGGQKIQLFSLKNGISRGILTHNLRERKLYFSEFEYKALNSYLENSTFIENVLNMSHVQVSSDYHAVVLIQETKNSQKILYLLIKIETGEVSNIQELKLYNDESITFESKINSMDCESNFNFQEVNCVLISSESIHKIIKLELSKSLLRIKTVDKFTLYKSFKGESVKCSNKYFFIKAQDLESSTRKLMIFSFRNPQETLYSIDQSELNLTLLNIQDVCEIENSDSMGKEEFSSGFIITPTQKAIELINLWSVKPFTLKILKDSFKNHSEYLQRLVLKINSDQDNLSTDFFLKDIFDFENIEIIWFIGLGLITSIVILLIITLMRRKLRQVKKSKGNTVEDELDVDSLLTGKPDQSYSRIEKD